MFFIENKKIIIIKIIVILIILCIIIFKFFISESNYNEFNSIDSIINTSPQNTINPEIKSKIKVYVTGEVNSSGVFELDENSRIEDAINLAGGLTEFANLEKINLAFILEDGQKLYIPSINDPENIEYISLQNGENIIENSNMNSNNSKININKANLEELKNLPGVGDSLAEKIFTYRKENGKFKSIEDLKKVNGIGEKKFESLKEYISI